jgi:hypothetical protein
MSAERRFAVEPGALKFHMVDTHRHGERLPRFSHAMPPTFEGTIHLENGTRLAAHTYVTGEEWATLLPIIEAIGARMAADVARLVAGGEEG